MLTLSTVTPHVEYDRSVALQRFGLPPNPAPERPALPLITPSIGKSYDGTAGVPDLTVEILPAESVERRTLMWRRLRAEFIQLTARDKVEFRFHAPVHLLVAYEQGMRRDGETVIDGLPRSQRRDLAQRLSFVPAGCEYREWHQPRSLSGLTYVYLDPAALQARYDLDVQGALSEPRLFFDDPNLWSTIVKLKTMLEGPASTDQLYLEALGVMLVHELMHPDEKRRADPPFRGGLASWQQRAVAAYIEAHLTEPIPLATLAGLVNLSPYHFCRAFKQTFGVPPHRYHIDRRIERAKELLAQRRTSVTDIGLALGFADTSSFSETFRKVTGITPSSYHRRAA